ncbi:2-succinyl-5-enolpyruvyl-6-hydroxy-3-cyclohexene-1-carboxylic-acid synthase [Mariniradius saccharolyticus AK6]|uniref:2-succinyl-5-enolpyruvyl-6-hydroxy-3-cyclohexene-1-carboxylate synthase n=1 Tax=Mariniradius saccharolyticus AK6 TaxID=1239962 RepID=M7X1R3_9BACT|nr:2-succinyl-5-enolpyruvyl-6-hydroxy-3-cyclohexene-1-carboxylic-acid synthase [Mariniradius saccharolyticus]EMS31425.1 2-succinyl-5-enolpyruvyl-6-hydroxy-3-cyclohexene-1-carboxylic-acid synthase [Mariniradius saccharolyticus AK6]
MILQPIVDLVSLCAKKGIRHAILSPGSRCAPITLAFARHPEIHTKTISDERSAAFIALGMAQQLGQPVALVCTSGSAAYNYAPAVAEAYFQQIPLLILTADRPPEWIDQWDGQTIRQTEIYGKHVKGFFQFPDEFGHADKVWHANRIVNEAINLAADFPEGPVHINIPLREPFYPEKEERFDFDKDLQVINQLKGKPTLSADQKKVIEQDLLRFRKILIVPGQQFPDVALRQILDQIAANHQAVVVTDSISNLQSSHTICLHDHYIGNSELRNSLRPDLIISFGKSIISKGLKLFLRSSEAAHWHIQPAGYAPDTYQHLEKTISCDALDFLQLIGQTVESNLDFAKHWTSLEEKVRKHLPATIYRAEFGEYKALQTALAKIPAASKIHVANSMAVRYLNFLGRINPEVYCNRGTSGIDGSSSTAVGCAFVSDGFVTLITGDMAFFYDRNAYWHSYPIPNLRIILLNNHAGGIFRLIDGPARQPELEEYFETKQPLSAKSLAAEFGFGYHAAADQQSLESGLDNFYEKSERPKILEILSESPKNAEVLKWVKAQIATVLK